MPGASGEYPVKPAAADALISVIIPCFNHARFLGEAIESVLGQTYRCVEVVVDDGSTDETATVAARYPTARYVRQAHQGLAAARNTGIAHSAGEYLAFVDADDRLLPDALAIGREWLRDHPDDAFVSGHYRFRYGDEIRLAERKHPAHPNAYRVLLQCNYITMHGAVLYRRGAVVAVGGFDQSLRACEDYDLYLRLAARDLTVLMRHGPVGIAARTAYRLLVRFARRRRGAVSLHGQ
jgi:glycosyltransferase involved in cell wall biosynthesis